MKVHVDIEAKCVTIDPANDLIRVSQIIVCKRIIRDGRVYLQFKDSDRIRSQCRGTCFVEIPLDKFTERLMRNLVPVLIP